jgi:hypothetical protein
MADEQVLHSSYRPLVPVAFPLYEGRQMRYHAFDLSHPSMPDGYLGYLAPVIALCAAAGANVGEAYLTVDEKVITAGMSQRRPRPHVDGCFRQIGDKMSWGGGGGSGWLHYCNDVGASPIGRMAVIVAASVAGCRAWKGRFVGRPAKDGDLSHIADQFGVGEVLPPNVGYLLSPDCVHESMTFERNTLRTFIRIALPVAFNDAHVSDYAE